MREIGFKSVIVINGQGQSGKDTVCGFVAEEYKARSISEITPIKELAKIAGWNGEKDDRSRKMLSDLKMLFVEYNDLPFNYAIKEIKKFLNSDDEILFIHIRECEEIEKIVKNSPVKTYTLLMKRTDEAYKQRVFGNASDDGVYDYNYDFSYVGNNKTKADLKVSFMKYFKEVVIKRIVEENN